MNYLRTPDACFETLTDYPFEPHYVDVDDFEGGTLRMHYVDEGPEDGTPVVMIHGNPTWSFMWRKFIPQVAAAGFRAIAIDLVGMGRSDKPTRMEDYSIDRHEKWVDQMLFDKIGLKKAHMVLHDWGGIIGLRVIANNMDKVTSITMSNTGLPVLDPNEEIVELDRPDGETYRAFQAYVKVTEDWKHWELLEQLVLADMPAKDVAGFAAPYPEKEYLTGNRQFTQMLPTRNDQPMLTENWAALQKLKKFEKPFQCIYSDKDQVAPDGYKTVYPEIPGTRAYEPIILTGGSHFLLEDIPDEYANAALSFLNEIDSQ